MNFFTNIKGSSTLIIVLLLLSFGAILQLKYDKIVHPRIMFTTETRYILPASIVSNFSFGFKNIIADLYWVRAIQDFSVWDGKDTFYAQEYKNIATLDPKFSYPYLLGILTFTSRSANDKNASSSLLLTLEPTIQTGIKNLPDNWEIPFYYGTGFQLTKNPEKALYYLKIAAAHPDAPPRIHEVYASYLKRALTGDNAAREFIKAIYETTESETTKKILEEGIMISDLTEILKGVVTKYKTTYGVYPNSFNDLVTAKMIQAGPELQKTFSITINKYTGEVKVTARGVK